MKIFIDETEKVGKYKERTLGLILDSKRPSHESFWITYRELSAKGVYEELIELFKMDVYKGRFIPIKRHSIIHNKPKGGKK